MTSVDQHLGWGDVVRSRVLFVVGALLAEPGLFMPLVLGVRVFNDVCAQN